MADSEAQTSMGKKKVLCRICLRYEEPFANIFEELRPPPSGPKIIRAELLLDLLKVQFNQSPLLPNNICENCDGKVKDFKNFRQIVQIQEKELQDWLQRAEESAKRSWADQTPGLNGNPGIFIPGPDCTVIEVDPEQDYEGSTDEFFSMETDSNDEHMSLKINPESDKHYPNDEPESSENNERSEDDSSQNADSDETWTMSPSPRSGASTPKLHSNSNNEVALEAIGKNVYLCQYCEMAFAKYGECKQHESRHDRAAPYNCALCSLRTTSREFRTAHIRERHNFEKPYICAVCLSCFKHPSGLRKHTVIHTGVRPFTCPVCKKSFSRNTILKRHIKVHDSARPHVCPHCSRSFSTVIERDIHAGMHAPEKPYKCSRCPAAYTRRYNLNRHKKTHNSHGSNSAKDADAR